MYVIVLSFVVLLIVVDPKHVRKTYIVAGQVRTFFFFDREAHISDFQHKFSIQTLTSSVICTFAKTTSVVRVSSHEFTP